MQGSGQGYVPERDARADAEKTMLAELARQSMQAHQSLLAQHQSLQEQVQRMQREHIMAAKTHKLANKARQSVARENEVLKKKLKAAALPNTGGGKQSLVNLLGEVSLADQQLSSPVSPKATNTVLQKGPPPSASKERTLEEELHEMGFIDEPAPSTMEETSAAELLPVVQENDAMTAAGATTVSDSVPSGPDAPEVASVAPSLKLEAKAAPTLEPEAAPMSEPEAKPASKSPKAWKSTMAVLAAQKLGAKAEEGQAGVAAAAEIRIEDIGEVAKASRKLRIVRQLGGFRRRSQSPPKQQHSAEALWSKASMRVKVTTTAAPTPWRDKGIPVKEKARLFLVTIGTAHAQTKSDVLLDFGHARTLVERMWNYDLTRLHEQALAMGADPLHIIKVAAEGNYGLESFDTSESILALIVLRLVKKPPSLAEKALQDTIQGVGCAKKGCRQPITGVACVGGCKWDYTDAAGPTSGCEIRDQNRHKGLVALRKLALDWQISPEVVFETVRQTHIFCAILYEQ